MRLQKLDSPGKLFLLNRTFGVPMVNWRYSCLKKQGPGKSAGTHS